MVRGCKRGVVFLKNTGSKLFREAYFIIDENTDVRGVSESDMVKEANRIIEENLAAGCKTEETCGKVRRILFTILSNIPAFLLGAGIAILFALIF